MDATRGGRIDISTNASIGMGSILSYTLFLPSKFRVWLTEHFTFFCCLFPEIKKELKRAL